MSPLGQTSRGCQAMQRGVQLQASDGRIETASDWAALTDARLGWPLPVEGLAFWIQGAPRTGVPFDGRGDRSDGAPPSLRQDGWEIVYQALRTAAPTRSCAPRG